MNAQLSISQLTKSFGAVVVADGLDLNVSTGEAVGILGPNGAGKTSLFNMVTGAIKADSGKIVFKDKDITRLSAAQRCKSGIARSFQVPQPFSNMSVFENTLIGATHGAGLSAKAAKDHAAQVLRDTSLFEKANTRAGSLTLLERKRLELARALAAKPDLLLLDEIAGGLTDAECGALIDTINHTRKNGTTIVWIEHVVHALLAVVEKLIVVDFGKKIAEGVPKEVLELDSVKEIYLGVE